MIFTKTNNFLPFNNQNVKLKGQIIKIINKTTSFKNITIVFDKKESPKYCLTTAGKHKANHCYIPFKFKKDDLFICIEKYLKDLNIKNAPELYIILHEIGHAKQHETIGTLNPFDFPVAIQQGLNLEYLYNGAANENKINQFMSENYREAFADCFAAFVLYKEFGQIEIFDKISDIRKERYKHFKSINGDEFIHPNFDYHSIKSFKRAIEKIPKPYTNLAYTDIESILETSLLRGSIRTIKKELETNDAFLVDFRLFSKEIENELINKGNNTLSAGESKSKVKDSSIISFFIEFQNRSGSEKIISDKNIIDLSQEKIFERRVNPKQPLLRINDYSSNNGIEILLNTPINILKPLPINIEDESVNDSKLSKAQIIFNISKIRKSQGKDRKIRLR